MNITLIYNDSKFNVDILNDTTCQYLYNIANKIFRLPFSQFRLVHKETEIENNSRLIFSVLSQIDPDNNSNSIIIRVESVPLPAIQSQTSIPTRNPSDDIKTESGKTKKNKGDTLCQICNYKNSIYYCRVCNLFVCFECNVRYNEHKNHDKINLEDGDAFLGCDVYREEIIKDINIIELGFKQTQQWMIDNTDREAFLQGLFKSLEYIRSHSLSLADMKTMYSLDQEMINDFKTEVDKIQVPKYREEIFESFNNLNLKENELRNYTKFLNLQIIKTEYNKVLLRCLDKVKQNMDQLGAEVKARLAECEEIKFRNINDIKLYLKEYGFKKKQNDIDNYLAKNYVPKEKNDKLNNEDNNEEEADDDDNNENEKNDMSDEKNNIIILNPVSGTNKKSNLKKNLLTISGAKFDKNRNLTLDKRLKGLKLKHDKVKNKFKLKELINNFTVSSLPKKKELLVPLKIKKSINLKKNETVNELSNIAKPKNLKKFLFNTKQELSEADFQDFPLNLKKKEKDIEKITKSPNRKNESDDNDLDNKLNAKNPINLKNIDFSGFIGQEKKISFMSPSRGRNNLYRKSIVKKTKSIFDNI